MSPEKAKHKHQHSPHPQDVAQAHLELKNEEADISARIDKLVSLTYDSNSDVRMRAAEELGKIDDPRSIFALLELSSDRDQSVKEKAHECLERFSKQEEKQAIVDLEKVFEAKHEGKQPAEEMSATRQKMLPSIEKLFSHKDPQLKARLLPSLLEKYFSTTHSQPPAASSQIVPSSQGKAPALSVQPTSDNSEEEDSEDEEISGEATHGLEQIGEEVEEKPQLVPQPSRRLTPEEQAAEAVAFPLPEALRRKTASPISEIESMLPETPANEMEEADKAISLHPNRIAFYEWAYSLAVDPKMTASKIRSEEKRLITQLKKDVELAFRLAIERAKTNGIESLSGIKVGMRKVATFPLLVTEVREANIPSGKKQIPAMRISLSDGKSTVPLYLDLHRANGIAMGDHVSLHGCRVDYLEGTNELVFLTGKKGYISVTK